MNVYDKLYELTKAIKDSAEFKKYAQAAETVDANPTHAAMVKDFIGAQVQITTMRMLGRDPDQDMIDHFNTLYTTVTAVSAIKELLEAQMGFSRIMDDINKELSEAISLDVSFLKVRGDTDEAEKDDEN
jgi:cell fate (sporulation/competence/biofilm development) regulator YlbF (YheA/YmcA/DUF963 family)